MGLSVAAVPVQRRDETRTPVRADLEVKRVLAGMASARLVYQPVVDLVRGEVVGYEALARFGTGGGLRAPGPYLAAAERTGRGADLEAHLLAQALAARDTVPTGCFLAVNVSPVLLASPVVVALLRAAGDLTGLVLELTEHVPVDNLTALRRRVDALRDRGALLALDDTGAGWSGLRQVAELRPDIVKLDRSLVSDVDDDEVKQGLVELVGQFVSRLGSRLLVEGVERFEELDAVVRLGVPLAQGWLLGRPSLRWSELPAGVAAAITERTTHTDARPRIGNQVDRTAPCVRHLATIGFLPGEPRDVVVVDGRDRPHKLWVRNAEDDQPSGWVHPVMTALADEQAHDVVARAMTRPAQTRFDPLVCVDATGAYVGLVHVEHLVTAAVTAAR
ncbi:MAG: diguanylate phosphodiesterase [Frankiales bacterium]|nr:diguanylate phosphodiesterase [Frankiales bacterium]